MCPAMITQRWAHRALGTALVLWIDPRTITHSVPRLEKHLTRVAAAGPIAMPMQRLSLAVPPLRPFLPFVLRSSTYPIHKPLEQNRALKLMLDLVAQRSDPARSRWWTERRSQLESMGSVEIKGRIITTEEALWLHLTTYLLPIVDSLSTIGWNPDSDGASPGAGSIGADGALFKAESVSHRFFIAHAAGVRSFPLRVRSVHEEWWQRAVAGTPRGDWPVAIRTALQSVETAHR